MNFALFFKIFFISTYFFSISYVHLRGQIKLKLTRQLFDHSSLIAPVNAIMYFFSSIPNKPFIDLSAFPELNVLKENWETIREEALFLYQEGYIASSDKQDDIGFNSFFRRGWKRFYLKWYQDPMPSANLCPKTLALIEQIPSINAAMFALLPKDSFLFPHRDPYAGSLRYHLGLITPNNEGCRIHVDGIPYIWRDGEAVMFDETFIHHAENNTEQDRIILFCDIKRPLRSKIANQINRLFSNTIMKSAASKNFSDESVGVINKIFGYVYLIRTASKKLKAFNRTLYYALKYSLFIIILYFIFFF